jgi:hypothetical protein
MRWNVAWQHTCCVEETSAPPSVQDDMSACIEISHGSTRTVWKEHLHLHPYKMTSVHALKFRISTRTVWKKLLRLYPHKMTSVHTLKCHMAAHVPCWSNICTSIPTVWQHCRVKRVEFCRQFRAGITANGEDILDVTSLTDETCFHLSSYVNNQNSRVRLATNHYEIKDTPLHDQKFEVWYIISRTRIISPLIFDDVIRWERLVWRGPLLLHGTLKWGKICPRILPADRCYSTHSSCFRDATERCAREQNNFKLYLATMVTRIQTPWLVSVWSNERRRLQRQSSHSARTGGSHRKFHQELPSDWIVACPCTQRKKFWEELITYFPFTVFWVSDTSRKKTFVYMRNKVNKPIKFERLQCWY